MKKENKRPPGYFDIILDNREGRELLAECMIEGVRGCVIDLDKANQALEDYYIRKRKMKRWVCYLRTRKTRSRK